MSFEPVPASGDGASCFDQPTLFYLTNKKQIDEWAALRSASAEAVGRWLSTTFRDRFAAAVAGSSLEVSYIKGPPAYLNVLAHPADMPRAKGKPAFGVGIGWSRNTANPTDGGSIYACVRASRTQTGVAATQRFLASGGEDFRAEHALKGKDNLDWPIYRNLQAAPQWWTNLDGYCDELLNEAMFFVNGTLEALRAAASVGDLGGPDEPD